MVKIIKCFLTVNPNELFYNFIKQMPDKKNTYICIDDNNYEIPNFNYDINIIKIENLVCEKAGFKNTHAQIKRAVSRDKALFFFYKMKINYDFIWFIEEDVFVPTIDTIKAIDTKYTNEDLLIRSHEIINKKSTDWFWWKKVHKQLENIIDMPYAWAKGAGISAIRCSKTLVDYIGEHAIKHKSLFLDEVLFNIIAHKNNLLVKDIDELKTITWKKEWKQNDIKATNLYHPIKNIETQYEFRKNIENNDNQRYLKVNLDSIKEDLSHHRSKFTKLVKYCYHKNLKLIKPQFTLSKWHNNNKEIKSDLSKYYDLNNITINNNLFKIYDYDNINDKNNIIFKNTFETDFKDIQDNVIFPYNKDIIDIAKKVSSYLKDYMCIHVRRGDRITNNQIDIDTQPLNIKKMIDKYNPKTVYIMTNRINELTSLTKYNNIYFFTDFDYLKSIDDNYYLFCIENNIMNNAKINY